MSLAEITLRTINIHAAKTHLSLLVEDAAAGEEIVIAKAGKPLARLVPLEARPGKRRLGALNGKYEIPDDFDTMCAEEIIEMFEGR